MRKQILFLVSILLLATSCEKKELDQKSKGQVQFSVKIDGDLKKAGNTAQYVVLSIEKTDGTSIYNAQKIELLVFNGEYISAPFALEPGDYKLTQFMVLDAQNNTIYATPKSGSPKAYLVKNPLDIVFSIQTDVVTKLSPEVLSTINATAKDFGYLATSFNELKTFDFFISVFVYNDSIKNFELVDAKVSISGDSNFLYQLPLSNKTNKITVNDSFSTFMLKINKPGYADFTGTYTADSLKAFFDNPLIVILKVVQIPLAGLVAYYPFNGNVNDESGNGKNGTNFGSVQYVDVSGNLARAFTNSNLNDANDYFTIPNSIGSEYTISCRFYVNSLSYYNTLFYLSSGNDWVYSDLWVALDPNLKISIVQESQDLRALDYSHSKLPSQNDSYTNCPLIQAGKYYDLALTYSSNTLKIYLDGSVYATYNNVNPFSTTQNTLLVGVSPKLDMGVFYYPFNGILDELRIYDVALSAENIADIVGE